ncbi:DNA-directed RNA polymerase I subunit 2 [Nicotiana tabacum]|uniref:DNA-directed RNA polymerase subunit beta n=1 Tax=Nicotiana tabacum TaxID=4097 RepID=A0A1S4BE24_TOBAC|nr:DNA-directed RNA polymerase I subunit 2 isoform X1 [Nicotiana tomentosiformis]XP_016487083.1 PREDICTED: DNA-directed RNA polymerase I subunit 2 [Nicotiana tabacum]
MEDQNEGKNKAMSRPHLLQEKDYSALKELFSHHIESFDHMVDNGLETMLLNIKPVEVLDSFSKLKLRIWFGKPEIFPPQKERTSKTMHDALYPFECRQAKLSYTGKFLVDICFQYGDGAVIREKFNFGQFPIMLKSKLCHLRAADDSKKLTAHKEEPSEMGGYFILKGLERVIRLLILPKRNYPMSMVRNSFRDRREGYSDKAVVIRCVREDQSAVSVKLYYLNNGSARLGFWIQGREYLLPVGIILKALVDTTDHEIYVNLTCCYNEEYDRVKGAVGTQLVGERAKIILDEVQALSLFTRAQCLQHIGEHFQPVMTGMQNYSYNTVADAVLRDYIFVHLDNNHDKFNLLVFMLQKLFSLIDQTSVLDNPDSLQNQEVLLPGHLITIYLKEKLQDWLLRLQRMLQEETDGEKKKFELSSLADVKKTIEKNAPKQMSLAIENMLKTGRLVTQSGLDLQQRAGMTVQAERLNFLRFLSHFRAVHRGASFAGLRTTSVRKLLPESWGFLCPVHTPDGEPCGLLNHMTASCRITSYYDLKGNIKDFFKIRESILRVLTTIGMIPSAPKLVKGGPPEELSVLLDGRIVGSMRSDKIEEAVTYLRRLKVSAISIPVDLEVGYIPLSMSGAYPGLYLFTSPSRFVRPVRNISAPAEEGNDLELIGPFEQVYMEISCPDGGDGGRKNVFPATHREIHPTNILSVVGNLTPWSDHNQSPRNMYQCQMGKQTMGFSSQALNCRADQKLYHLQTPQTPIVRTKAYEKYCVDDYPLGTNAIVAVLAYSGYDMEDAMVLNKSSVDRGLCHGHIYQTETIDLTEQSAKSDRAQRVFRRSYLDKSSHQLIDSDGLPYVGQRINPHEPYCTIYNEITSQTTNMKLKGSEPVVVDYVAVDVKNKTHLQKANIRFRRSRNPVIGDKFSSRHGQKGVCSQLWPDIDMPFSGVTGMRPDLIINPHAFPSRMTIAMLLESIAAKGGALHGKFVDATPFSNTMKDAESESSSLVDELGSMLTASGFNYHGVEVLYSGVYGTELTCEIFIGPVYYQRLRHMVSDKFQVRSTGTVDQVTRQPIKGRKRGGGIRFGEMERDSLLAHGAAYLLHDRLHTSSDHHIADVCSECGSILTASLIQPPKQKMQEEMRKISGLPPAREPKKVTCLACRTSKGMETVAMPYVFKYLAAELAAMNIKMTLKLSNGAGA